VRDVQPVLDIQEMMEIMEIVEVMEGPDSAVPNVIYGKTEVKINA